MDFFDDELIRIERAAKTVFPWLAPAHHQLRRRFSWYQRWHEHPHARRAHHGALIVALVVATSSIYQAFLGATPVFASDPDITTNTVWCDQGDIPASIGNLTIESGVTLTIGGTSGSSLNSAGGPDHACSYEAGGWSFTGSGTLTILGTGKLVVGSEISGSSGASIPITFANVSVASGAKITADEQGFQSGTSVGGNPGAGPGGGAGPSTISAGGGYGGAGGSSQYGAGGSSYGSATEPTDLGSSGGGTPGGYGGTGGGAIHLNITGNLTVDGSISAKGGRGSGWFPGGGSGGSVYVVVGGTISGAGSMAADGGSAPDGWTAGGGGGGRIAVYYNMLGSFTPSSTTATGGAGSGGANGSNGTVGFFQTTDYTGHATDVNRSLFVYQSFIYPADTTLSLKNITADSGAILKIGGGSTVNVSSSVVVTGSSTITLQGKNTTGQVGGAWAGAGVTVNAATVEVDTGSSITANAQGYSSTTGAAGNGPGGGSGGVTTISGGGGYGGTGGTGRIGVTGGASYGSAIEPTDLGSSGGGTQDGGVGGSGGGAIKLNVTGNVTVDGTISADGGVGAGSWNHGGGAGGSVYLVVGGTLAGSGSVHANGGSGDGGFGSGGGAGGRIAVYYNTLGSFNRAGATATGGTSTTWDENIPGGTGTVGFFQTTDYAGHVTDANRSLFVYQRFEYPSSATVSIKNTTIDNGGTLTFDVGSRVAVSSDVSVLGGATLQVNTTTFSIAGSLTVDGASSNGVLVPDSSLTTVQTITVSHAGTLTVGGGSTITASGLIKTTDAGSSIVAQGKNTNASSGGVGITLTAANLQLDSGTSLTANGQGYLANDGPGGAPSGTSAGGSHGGRGGTGRDGSFAPADSQPTYDSADAPTDLGSGGGSRCCGATAGVGGGAIRITLSGTLTLNGTMSANGTNSGGAQSGGGAGGSIYVLTGTLTGSGSVATNGGNGSEASGGGGRIAMFYNTRTSDTTTRLAAAGTGGGAAGPGTIKFGSRPMVTLTAPSSGGIIPSWTTFGLTIEDADHRSATAEIQYVSNPSADCSSQDFSAGVTTVESTTPSSPSGDWSGTGIYDASSGTVDASFAAAGGSFSTGYYCWRSAAKGTSGDYQLYGDYSLVRSLHVDSVNPVTASISNVTDGAVYRASTVPSDFSGSVADDAAGVGMSSNSATFTLQRLSDNLYWNGTTYGSSLVRLAGSNTATANGSAVSWTSSATLPSWTDGRYTVQARATDRANNASDGAAVSFTYDATPPTAPSRLTVSADGTSPSGQAWVSSTSQLTASWSASTDATSGIQKYQVAIGTTSGGTNIRDWADAGSGNATTISGLNLTNGAKYYVSVRAVDNAGNIGDATVSQSVEVDTAAPAAVSDLAVTGGTDGTVTLSWTAPGDDGSTGTASSFDVRYSTSPITSDNFSSASAPTLTPTPGAAGTTATLTISELTASSTYSFAVETTDNVGRVSSLSNVVTLSIPAAATSSSVTTSSPLTSSSTSSSSPSSTSAGTSTSTSTVTVTVGGVDQTLGGDAIHVPANQPLTVTVAPDPAKTVTGVVLTVGNSTIDLTKSASGNSYTGGGRSPLTAGTTAGSVTIRYADGTSETKPLNLLVDPLGYVYVTTDDGQQRLAGATVSIYQLIDGRAVLWDGAKYGQTNPQTTGPDGSFNFFVPAGTYRIIVSKDGKTIYTSPDQVVTTQPISLTIDVSAALGYTPLPAAPAALVRELRKLGPTGVAVAQVVASASRAALSAATTPAGRTTATVTPAVTTLAVAASTAVPLAANAPLLNPLGQLLAWLLSLLGRRRKPGPFGTVRDAESGQPVAGALVRILTADEGKLLDTQTTDVNGQFSFLLGPGLYQLQVAKAHYQFPSTIDMSGYRGAVLQVASTQTLALTIPLDPEVPALIHRFQILALVERLAEISRLPLLIVGSMIVLLYLVLEPSFLHVASGILYALLWVYEGVSRAIQHPAHGQIVDQSTHAGLGLAIVRIADEATQRLIASKVSDNQGSFGLRIPSGRYHATVTRAGYQRLTSAPWQASRTSTLVTQTFALQPALSVRTDEAITTPSTGDHRSSLPSRATQSSVRPSDHQAGWESIPTLTPVANEGVMIQRGPAFFQG